MQLKQLLLALTIFLLQAASAQDHDASISDSATTIKRNLIKTNITSIPLRNYSLQYERVVSKTVSLVLTYRTMPTTYLPFQNLIIKAIGYDDPDTRDVISRTKLGNYAITPEVRFYLGKGYGKGFYIAPYYRHVKIYTNQVPVSYNSSLTTRQTLTLSGDMKANTGGILFGAQWFLGKRFCLDWWIVGAHFGRGNGNFSGLPATPLTTTEQQEIRDVLEGIEIPLTDKTITITPNNVAVKLDGAFGGFRGGINFGIRF